MARTKQLNEVFMSWHAYWPFEANACKNKWGVLFSSTVQILTASPYSFSHFGLRSYVPQFMFPVYFVWYFANSQIAPSKASKTYSIFESKVTCVLMLKVIATSKYFFFCGSLKDKCHSFPWNRWHVLLFPGSPSLFCRVYHENKR